MNLEAATSLLVEAEQARLVARGSDAKTAFAQLESRYADLITAMEWTLDQGRTDDALRFGIALAPFWTAKKRLDEGSQWLGRALRLPGGKDADRARASIEAGFLAFWKGEDEIADALYERGLELGRQISDPVITVRALSGLARVALRSNIGEARRLCIESLAVAETSDDNFGRSNIFHVLGVAAQLAGNLLEARDWMNQRLQLARELGHHGAIGMEASNLSAVERQLGNLERAEDLAREALQIFRQRGDEWAIPFGISGLAAIATERSDVERAAILVGAAEALMQAQGAAWPPDERVHYERMLVALPDAMGEADFERARAAGRSMLSSDAVDFALGDLPR